jgi:hypothetical protein
MHRRLQMLSGVLVLLTVLRVNAQETAAGMSLTIGRGHMTCTIRNYPIGQVAQEIGARAGIVFVTRDDIADDRISLELADVPLDEAVRRLLRGYDAFLYYGGNDAAPASLRVVWILPKGSGAALQPLPPESCAETAELQQALDDPNPAVRERAYVALMSRPGAAARETVLNALRGASENDEVVRQRLLTSAVQQALEIPPDLLADIARADGSEVLRLLALDALAADPAVKDVAAFLASDPSSMVQQRAREILTEWEGVTPRQKIQERP